MMAGREAAAISATTSTSSATPPPTALHLRRVFMAAAIPMIGFGFMDQTVMIQAGNFIDCTIGVTFGLSTMTAAAFGQVCSDGSGILFGSTLEHWSQRAGLPAPQLSEAQRVLPVVTRTKFAGAFLGVLFGCCLGLGNLLLIDTSRSSTLKKRASQDEQEFQFVVEASNAERSDATALTVRGPDVDGILASMTAALAVKGCSLVELHAKRNITDDDQVVEPPPQAIDINGNTVANDSPTSNTDGCSAKSSIQDVFYVVQRDTGRQFADSDLPDLAQALLDATRAPIVSSTVQEHEQDDAHLRNHVNKLEQVVVQEKQITILPRRGATL